MVLFVRYYCPTCKRSAWSKDSDSKCSFCSFEMLRQTTWRCACCGELISHTHTECPNCTTYHISNSPYTTTCQDSSPHKEIQEIKLAISELVWSLEAKITELRSKGLVIDRASPQEKKMSWLMLQLLNKLFPPRKEPEKKKISDSENKYTNGIIRQEKTRQDVLALTDEELRSAVLKEVITLHYPKDRCPLTYLRMDWEGVRAVLACFEDYGCFAINDEEVEIHYQTASSFPFRASEILDQECSLVDQIPKAVFQAALQVVRHEYNYRL